MLHRDFIPKAIGSLLVVFVFLAPAAARSGAFSELQTA